MSVCVCGSCSDSSCRGLRRCITYGIGGEGNGFVFFAESMVWECRASWNCKGGGLRRFFFQRDERVSWEGKLDFGSWWRRTRGIVF